MRIRRRHEHREAKASLTSRAARGLDSRLGLAKAGQGTLRKIFPNHWSFLLGEVALYSFVVLLLTGVFLTFFFDPSQATTTYDGSYEPLQGFVVSEAYNSALDITFDVRAGLMMRQMHHWAALIFLAAIVVHLARVFFTGAFRRPRELNWSIGLSLLLLAIMNGFFGYSLLDDQLSGTGVRIMYSLALAVPFVGTWISSLLFGGGFPGDEIVGRMYILHVLVLPALIVGLLAAHMGMLIRHKHTHFPGKGARDDNVVGERLWPTYAFKAGGLFFCVAAVLALLGGLVQINPVWMYGPYIAENVSAASQPDWYMGWADGALRLMPNWEWRGWGYTLPNPLIAAAISGVVFPILFAWPWVEARLTKDHAEHHVLDRPRDRPVRTALGVAGITFYTVLGLASANDVIAVTLGMSLNGVLWAFRILLFVAPPVLAFVAYRVCKELQLRDGPAPVDTAAQSPGPATDDPPVADQQPVGERVSSAR